MRSGKCRGGISFLRDKFLHAFAVDFGDVNRAVFGDGDAMREKKVAGLGAEFAEGVEDFSFYSHLYHAMGAAVGDEQRVVGRDEQAEGCEAAEGAEEFAVLVEDLDAVVLAVA